MEVSSALSFTSTGGRARWSPLATMNGYRQNLLTVRQKALEHGLPFWNCAPHNESLRATFGAQLRV